MSTDDAPRLCPKHEGILARCLALDCHATKTARKRLRRDAARFCTPGRYGCPPLSQETT